MIISSCYHMNIHNHPIPPFPLWIIPHSLRFTTQFNSLFRAEAPPPAPKPAPKLRGGLRRRRLGLRRRRLVLRRPAMGGINHSHRWRFPEIGVPRNHPLKMEVSLTKTHQLKRGFLMYGNPYIWGYLPIDTYSNLGTG